MAEFDDIADPAMRRFLQSTNAPDLLTCEDMLAKLRGYFLSNLAERKHPMEVIHLRDECVRRMAKAVRDRNFHAARKAAREYYRGPNHVP